MKLTKLKLKQLIQETLNETHEEDYDHVDEWSNQLERTVDAIQELAEALKDADPKSTEHAREVLHRRIDEYLEPPGEEEESREEEEEGEYEMLPRPTEDPMGRGAQTSKLRRQSTNWRKGETFYETN